MEEVANQWNGRFLAEYRAKFASLLQRYADLAQLSARTEEEEREFRWLQGLSGGFCVAGHMQNDRIPHAFEITYAPEMAAPTPPKELKYDLPRFWGCPNLMHRLMFGVDLQVFERILGSQQWQGSDKDLLSLISPLGLPGSLPLREAVDWIYSSIYITIKAMKFSRLAPICGGPIEVATITSDRRFRWVTHKGLGEAITPPAFRKET